MVTTVHLRRTGRLGLLPHLAVASLLSGCASLHPPYLDTVKPSDFITVDGAQVYKMERGTGVPIALLHGTPDHTNNLTRLIAGVAKAGRVIAYDRRGFGISDKPDLTYTVAEQLEEFRKIDAQLHMTPGFLIGHSYGAFLSALLAADQPSRVNGLVLIDPVLVFKPGHTGLTGGAVGFFTLPIIGDIMSWFHARWATASGLHDSFYDQRRLTDEMIDSFHYPFQTAGGERSFLRHLRALQDTPELKDDFIAEVMRKIREANVPVLMLWGENDPTHPSTDAPALAKALNAELHIIPNCGHLPQLELDDARLQVELIAPINAFVEKNKPR